MNLKKFFEVEEDPVGTGVMIILVIFAITVLFWLFWSLMVYGGGLFAKIIPLITVVFTSKGPADFGFEGWHEQGIFEGWPVNMIALLLLCLFTWIAVMLLGKETDRR